MAYKSLKELFDTVTAIPKIDRQFISSILMFVTHFINKNEESTSFFGGHLLGVDRPKWGDKYESVYWLQEICGIQDLAQAQRDIYDIPIPDSPYPQYKTISSDWNVGSNLVNLSFLYVAYRIYTAPNLAVVDRDQGVIYTIIAAQIKHLCSLMNRRFQYQANEAVAMAHFESLDYRSDLKRLGSWFALLKDRGEQTLKPEFKKRDVLKTYETSYEVVKWANDLQDRIRKVLNGLTSSFHETHDQEDQIKSFSRIQEIEGIQVVTSSVSGQRQLIAKLQDCFADSNDLINDELMDLVDKTLSTSDPRYLKQVLTFLVRNYRVLSKMTDQLSESMVLLVFRLARENQLELTKVPQLYVKLMNAYRSSQTKREDILQVKDICRYIVSQALPSARQPIQTGAMGALYGYLCLLIFTLKVKR